MSSSDLPSQLLPDLSSDLPEGLSPDSPKRLSPDLPPEPQIPARPAYQQCRRCGLRGAGMFCSFSVVAWEQFERIGQHVSHPARGILFKEGDRADAIYAVCSGQLKLSAASGSGCAVILKIARPGDVLGLSAALNGVPHEVTAMTIEAADFMQVGRSAFLEFMATSAEASRSVAVALAKEHREFVLIARRLALRPFASGRVARILIDFAADKSAATPGKPLQFKMRLTHGELASLAATSRETVTRLLNRLERAGILARDNSTITILEPATLERLAGSRHPGPTPVF